MLIKKVHLMRILFMLMLFSLNHDAQAASPADEYRIKAAFLYNFAKFVEWPPELLAEDDAPYVFGIIGRGLHSNWMQGIEGRTIRGRGIIVRQIQVIDEVEGCHILFVDQSMGGELEKIIEKIANKPVLTVGDQNDFALRGGIINFIKCNNKMRFEMNVNAAQRAGLKISSKLLKLARIVIDNSKSDFKGCRKFFLVAMGY